MQKNTPAPADLISDMGKSSGVAAQSTPQEQQLMRVAHDPLALREFLLQERGLGPGPTSVTLLPGDAAIGLARGMVIRVNPGQVRWLHGDMHYRGHEDRPEAAVHASVFAPSSEDRERALDLRSLDAKDAGTSGFALVRWGALCIVAILLAAMLHIIIS